MVKKPAGAARKPAGAAITKFFDIQAPTSPQARPAAQDGAGGAEAPAATPPAPGDDQRGPPPPGAWRPKHLVEAPDMGMMSQDSDALCVVWHDSPGASQLLGPAGGRTAAAGTGAPAPAAGATAGAQQQQQQRQLHAIKQRLISAVQRPRGVVQQHAGQALLGRGPRVAGNAQAEALLEGLFAHDQTRPAVGAGPECSVLSGCISDVAGAGAGSHKTPATHLRGILKKPLSAGAAGAGGAGQRATPGSCVKFHLGAAGSAGKPGPGRSAKQGASTGKRRQCGQKRKALLELLEQVESLVQSGDGAAEGGDPDSLAEDSWDEGPCEEEKENVELPGNSQGAVRAPACAAHKAGDAQCAAKPPPQQPAALRAPQAPGLQPPPTHRAQPQQPAACGPSQPPAGPRGAAHGGLPLQPAAHHGPRPFPSINTGTVPQRPHAPVQPLGRAQGGLPPAAVAPGARQQQQPGGQPSQQPPRQQQLQQQPPPSQQQQQQAGSGSGGFAEEDDMDEDSLLAELELQLVTQAEQKHAAAQQARARAAAAATALPAGNSSAPPPAGSEQVAAAPGIGAHIVGGGAPAAAPLPAAGAPPAPAQELAAAPGSMAPAAQQPPAASGDAQPAAPAAGTDGAQGSDSWGDEDDLDTEMLAEAEAAALRDRAERSLHGELPGPSNRRSPPLPEPPKYAGDREEVHYTITEIINSEHDQVLRLFNKHKGREVFAHLRAPWSDLPYRVGDPVNLVARLDVYDGQLHCLLNMEHGLLVLHPDVLLSGTRITGSNNCPRQSILDERIAGDGSSAVAVKGTLQHLLIQAALQDNLRTARELNRRAEEIVAAHVEALLEVDMDEAAALTYLREATPGILRWMKRFLKDAPGQDSLVSGGYDPAQNREIRRCVAVQEVVDIEESVWATKFGVKGMVDVSVKMALEEPAAARQHQVQGWARSAAAPAPGEGPSLESVIAPIEIKTGKPHDSHRAQVLLYLLLMEERYGRPLDWGLLWYTTQPDPQLVQRKPPELSSLMAVRNRLAAYIANREMAPLADFKKQCHWCYQKHNCALYHRAVEGGSADSFKRVSTDRSGGDPHNVGPIFDKQAGHLTPADCEFLKKWDRLIDLEEGDTLGRRAEIWSTLGEERERAGRCLAGLALQHVDETAGLCTFLRAGGGGFEGSALVEGEMVLLSIEGRHVTVARATIYALTPAAVTISLRKPLRRGLLLPCEMSNGTPTMQPPPNLAPAGPAAAQQAHHVQQQQQATAAGGPAPMEVDGLAPAGDAAAGAPAAPGASAAFEPAVRWRLDRDDVSSTFVKLRANVFSLFRPEDERAARLRHLVVGLAPPEAALQPPGAPDPTPAGMNHEQHEAVHRVLASKDYTLVLGMPGAGKTTTIVSMVQALVAQGKSVLVTSYTNSAVDNILVKLAAEGVPFVRLGREQTVHPAVRPWLPGGEQHPERTVAALRRLGETVPVVGATCFGVSHAMLKSKVFDVCILDEAGQVTLPASLAPLLKSRAFVLVGDHNQLPPLVANREAEEGGMGVSLFRLLSEAHPQAVVALPVQYRMSADIQDLANELFYQGQLRCGTPGVAEGALAVPAHGAAAVAALPGWLQQVLDPQRRVLFLDTAEAGAQEALAGDTLSNAGEAGLVLQVLQAAAAAGIAQERVGVISPYRAQVALLDRLAKERGLPGVECLTVDKCQGRDKDCVVVSFVRSNAQGEAGKLLQDWRRINVAVTRAKRKLVLLGDSTTLGALPLFQRLLGLVRDRGWYLRLPAGCAALAAAGGGGPSGGAAPISS